MNPALIVIFGLPGVGKTTACRMLSRSFPELYYADTRSDPRWKSLPMYEVCSLAYLEHGRGKHLLTDGTLPRVRPRDRFIRNVLQRCGEHVRFAATLSIMIHDDDFDVLSTRRKRSPDEYAELMAELEPGSSVGDFARYTADPEERTNPDERARRLEGLIRGWLLERGLCQVGCDQP